MVYTITKLVSAFAFGLVIGCYLNTLEYRLRADVRLFDSSCYCTSCGARLRLADQIPVISYLRQRGRCRSCGAHIGRRYPIVEAGSALLYLVCAAVIDNVLVFYFTATLAGILYVTVSILLRGKFKLTRKYVLGIFSLIGLNIPIMLGMSIIALESAVK